MSDDDSDDETRAGLQNALRQIPRDFYATPNDRFNPLPYAVRILGLPRHASSSTGKTQESGYEELRQHFRVMDTAAASAVNAYSEGFGTSIANYSEILRNIVGAQNSVRRLRRGLEISRQYLADDGQLKSGPLTAEDSGTSEGRVSNHQTSAERRQIIEVLWRQHLECEAMLDLYARIERVTQAPTDVEEQARRKDFLHAARTIAQAVEDLFSEDLLGIRALSSLRRNLIERKNSLRDTVLTEIVEFVYRSPRRWHRRIGTRGDFPSTLFSVGTKSQADFLLDPNSDFDTEDEDEDEDEGMELDESVPLESPPEQSLSGVSGTPGSGKFADNKDLESIQGKIRPRSTTYLRILTESVVVLERAPLAVIVSTLLSSVRPRIQKVVFDLHKRAYESLEQEHIRKRTVGIQYSRKGGHYETKEDRRNREQALSHFFVNLFERCLAILEQHVLMSRTFCRQLRGTTTPYDSVVSLFSVWSVMQQELEKLVCGYLDIPDAQRIRGKPKKQTEAVDVLTPTGGGSALGASGAPVASPQNRVGRLFSFASSSAATFYASEQIQDSAQSSSANTQIVAPSPYNVRALFSFVQSFDDRVHEVMHKANLELLPEAKPKEELKSKSNRLNVDVCVSFGTFLDAYVLESFLPRLKVDIRKRVEASTDHIYAWHHQSADPRSLSNGRTQDGKLNVTVELSEMFHELADLHDHLNGRHTAYILSLLCASTERFAVAVRMKLFGEVLKDTLCAERLGDGAYFRLLQQDPLFSTARSDLCGGLVPNPQLDDAQNDAFVQAEYDQEKAQNWFGPDKHIFQNALIGSSSASDSESTLSSSSASLDLLAGIAVSCGWLAQEASVVQAQIAQKKDENAPDRQRSKRRPLSHALKKESKHSQYLARTIDKLCQLAEHAMMALRVELRIRCQFYLDEVREARYALADADSGGSRVSPQTQIAPLPDGFVVELNAELASFAESVDPLLTRTQRRYLWDGIPSLIAHLLSIHALSKMSRRDAVDQLGAAKMIRNMSALQQQLTNISPECFREGPFDRVRRFYTLLGQSPTADALLSNIAQHVSTAGPAALGFDEYRALLEYKHRGRLPERIAADLREIFRKRNL